MNEKTQKTTLLVGLSLVLLCALFPPRRYIGDTISVNRSTVAPRGYLWHSRLHVIDSQAFLYRAEIDTGKLLAEVIVFAALTGGTLLYFRR